MNKLIHEAQFSNLLQYHTIDGKLISSVNQTSSQSSKTPVSSSARQKVSFQIAVHQSVSQPVQSKARANPFRKIRFGNYVKEIV